MGLTGIEQYSYERAGYFVRRGLIPSAFYDMAAPYSRELENIAKDILGSEVVERKVNIIPPEMTWSRDPWAEGAGFTFDQPNLAKLEAVVCAIWSLETNIALQVVPGSQSRPLGEENVEN